MKAKNDHGRKKPFGKFNQFAERTAKDRPCQGQAQSE